jgi:capsular exopolysaccharide synthesis family protein
MQNSNQSNSDNSHDESINIRELVEKYLFYWKWFVFSIFISLVFAFLYLRFTPKEYQISTTILIEDEEKGGLVSELSVFEDLGILEGQTSLDNEIELLKSRALMERVIKDLGVNVTYYQKGRIRGSEIYNKEVPIKINFFNKDSIFYKQDTTFIIQIKSATTFSLKNSKGEKKGDYSFGQDIKTKFGDITITPSNFLKTFKESEIIVKIKPLNEVIEYYRNQIQILPVNKKASVINISLKDRKKLKAETIVNNLVNQYNEDAVSFKSLIRKKTNSFIEERLEIINEELLVVEQGAEAFKTENRLTNIDSEADLVLESKSDLKKNIIDLTTQLKLVEYISDYLKRNTNDLIPANLGLSEGGLDQSTQKYNELLSERNRILRSSSELNPVISNLNKQISNVRESIVQGLINLESSLTISINQIKQEDYRLSSKMAAAPRQEREYRNIQRQQEIIEALYLYLLQKREENAITLAVTLPNAKIIDRAYGKNVPVSPKPTVIYLVALFLGFVFAFLTLYIKLLLNNKVHNSKEVEAIIKAPLLGEIPKTKGKQKVVINTKDRSGIAESFRMLRTNLDIILSSSKKGAKTIFITSTISNEGKTFISVNLASVIALLNKKVLLIGADIREPKLEEYLDIKMDKGLTHFLIDSSLKVQDVISHIDTYNIDVLHSGISAPNPSELLSNGRFEEILDYAKDQYDFIIVDTPPVNLVTDTFLLGKNADLFLYIIRADYLDKRMLEIPAKLFEEKRLPNMAMVLNDTDFEKGYGYGYGKRINKKPWWKK